VFLLFALPLLPLQQKAPLPSLCPSPKRPRAAAVAADNDADGTAANYFLLKTEPSHFSIQDMARLQQEDWDGVRNYQARNILRTM